jgi:putative flippase GtrA
MTGATPATAVRWVKFSSVGAIGILVQLATLALLASALRINFLLATALAVEAAVIHNFIWHERFTWADRRSPTSAATAHRFLRFNLTAGLLSIAGNLLLMQVFAGMLHIPYLPANGLSIACCALLNFLASDRLVFY